MSDIRTRIIRFVPEGGGRGLAFVGQEGRGILRIALHPSIRLAHGRKRGGAGPRRAFAGEFDGADGEVVALRHDPREAAVDDDGDHAG